MLWNRRPRPSRLAIVALLVFAASGVADEKLAGIACRSVHLNYPAPEGVAFVNEVTVEKTSEGTYFCVCGFNQGYFGIQEQSRGKKVVIFSVWDPGKQDNPNAVAEEQRVKLVSKDDQVRVGRFGNEGTGGQSFLDLDWKVGETYGFLVKAKIEGERTLYSASIRKPGAKEWRHLATFSTLAKGKLLGGYYSFIEDFRRNKVSATVERRAKYGEGWVQDKDGKWHPLTRARFTGDSNPSRNIDAGTDLGKFFLATGGDLKNDHVPLNKSMEVEPGQKPEIP